MNEVKIAQQYQEGDFLFFELEEQVPVIRIRIVVDSPDVPVECNKFLLKYAQNSVMDELKFMGIHFPNKQGVMDIELSMPNDMSHFCLDINEVTSKELKVVSMEIYADSNVDTSRCYPKVYDTDLMENHYLDAVTVFTSPEGYSHYTLYTSMDGRDFDMVAHKNTNEICQKEGETYVLNGKEARYIRVYLEYSSRSAVADFEKITYEGTKSGTPVIPYAEPTVVDFEHSVYNVEVTDQDAIDEVYGIIERRLGKKYQDWFTFEVGEQKEFDYYEISAKEGKVHIAGNCGVSMATGLNYYLKTLCKVNLSEVGDQAKMPEEMLLPEKPIYRETKAKVRYANNYCVLSYTMGFWGEEEWRREIDWYALNGINVVLDVVGQEEVWRRFLKGLGYSHDAIKGFLCGPPRYAWAYMANHYGVGGPVHDSWFETSTELARKNHLIMRKLGMSPAIQGYSGMVPPDIQKYDAKAEVIHQGTWCSLLRPFMLRTTCPSFLEYAERYYQAQKEVFGENTHYYSTDPFHEGGLIGNMSLRHISQTVLKAMLKADPDARWIIQSWQHNPRSEFLAGLGEMPGAKDHMLILDLWGEKIPKYNKGGKDQKLFGYDREFDHTPWIYCMLNNFGGRLGLFGHLDSMCEDIYHIFNNCTCIKGVGIVPEACENNPVLYEFIYDSIWQENAKEVLPKIDLTKWICDYAERRCGKKSASVEKAWAILLETVYKSELNMKGQGAPECVVNARPALNLRTASAWGNVEIEYDGEKVKEAAELMLSDYDALKDSECYLYDAVSVIQQVFSNEALKCYKKMSAAYLDKDLTAFEKLSDAFMKLAGCMEELTSSNRYYRFGRWTSQAAALAEGTDDFTKRLYDLQAKAAITTDGPYNQSEISEGHDYSNRQWAGLIQEFYMARWALWIEDRTKELKGEPYEETRNWFEWEWNWNKDFTMKFDPTPEAKDIRKIWQEGKKLFV